MLGFGYCFCWGFLSLKKHELGCFFLFLFFKRVGEKEGGLL